MKDSGDHSGSKKDVLDTSRMCEMLAAARLRHQQQRAELLTPLPRFQGSHSVIADMESNEGSAESLPAFALERMTSQKDTLPQLLPTGTNEGSVSSKEDQNRKGMEHEERAVNQRTALATILATAEPQLSPPTAPMTPENRTVKKEWKEHNEGTEMASMSPDGDLDPEAEIDPFISVPEFMSESVKMEARRAAFDARLSPEFIDWIDDIVRDRANKNSMSPIPVARACASSEWRKAHRARQAKLVRVSPGGSRPTQTLGLRKAQSSPELAALMPSSSVAPREFTHVVAEPALAASQLSDPYVIVERLCAGNTEAEVTSMQHAAELEGRTNRGFFNRRKRSRFSTLFESFRAGKH